MSAVRNWLEGLGLGDYAEAFEAEKIGVEALAELTEADLKELGLPIGPRRLALKAARALAAAPIAAPPPAPASRAPPHGIYSRIR